MVNKITHRKNKKIKKSMTKKDLTEQVAIRTGATVTMASIFVDAYNNAMIDFLKNDKSVYIRGFATFKVAKTKAKKARNIALGTSIDIPERKKVKFIKSTTWHIE